MRLPSSDRVPADAIAGTVVALVGAGYTAIALGIPADSSEASIIGPAVFPLLFGGGLTVGGLVLLAGALAKARGRRAPVGAAAAPPPPAAPPMEVPEVVAGPRGNFWVLMGLLAGYILIFLPLGFLLATALYLMAMTTYLRRRKIVPNLLFALLLPTAVYLLFGFGLQITLPAGVLSGVLP
jgi:putative tricarboxylic transport membrane protein